MTLRHDIHTLHQAQLQLLSQSHDLTPAELVAAGLTPSTARRYRKLAVVLRGPTRFKKQQRETWNSIVTKGVSLEAIDKIETAIAHLTENQKWKLRRKLTTNYRCYASLCDALSALVGKYRGAKPEVRKTVRTTQRTKKGETSVTITGPVDELNDLVSAINQGAQTPDGEGRYEAFMKTIKEGAPSTTPTPVIGLWLDEAYQILEGENGEKQYLCPDGTIRCGRDLMQSLFLENGLAVLVHEKHGPLELRRTQRSANESQKIVLQAFQCMCQRPGCTKPGVLSRVHHVQAWKNGGTTDIRNLALLCDYHNGTNDDDRGKYLHGHLLYKGWYAVWQYPSGRQQLHTHPLAKLSPMYRLLLSLNSPLIGEPGS